MTLKSNGTEEQVDRFQEVFGQKSNFIVHASVAILSFLVFGLVPPVVYGFSFYESDNRELKLAAVAASFSFMHHTTCHCEDLHPKANRVVQLYHKYIVLLGDWARGLWHFFLSRLLG